MSSEQNIIIWIVEDDQLYRESLESLFEMEPGLRVAIIESSAEAAIDKIGKAEAPAVILHDIGLPGLSGIEAIEVYRRHFPDVKIIMLTIFEDDERVYKAIEAGASGYLLKRTSGKKLVQGVRNVIEGDVPMSPGIARNVLDMLVSGGPKKETNLTSREKDILQLMVEGLTMDMISGKLSISSHTVDTHIKNIYRKMEVHNRAEVVAKAIKERII